MENPMGDLRKVAEAITAKLADGSLPVRSETEPSACDSSTKSPSTPPQLTGRVERLTEAQARRREVIKQILLRYQEEKNLDTVSDDKLYDDARFLDEHFTYARIPTARIPEVYMEAMAHHGPYLLKADDYLRAWARLGRKEGDAPIVRGRGIVGEDGLCSKCHGTGTAKKWKPRSIANPYDGEEIEIPCGYGCRPMMVKL